MPPEAAQSLRALREMPLPGLEGWRSIHLKTFEAQVVPKLFPRLHGQIREHQRANACEFEAGHVFVRFSNIGSGDVQQSLFYISAFVILLQFCSRDF